MTDASEEQVAASAPNQQPRESECLGVMPNIAIGFCSRELAEHRALRVAGSINQHQQRQRHTEGDALENAQRQLSDDDDCGDSKLPTAASEQVAQIAGL